MGIPGNPRIDASAASRPAGELAEMVDAFVEQELAGKPLRRPRWERPEHVRRELEPEAPWPG